MRGRTPFSLAVGVGAVALLAAGCTSSPGTTPEPGPTDLGGELRIYASEPAFLVPTAADDDPSIQVIRQLYRGLVKYNTETGADELDLAESIESDDNVHWTIKIKPGYSFTNGEAVNADAFIRGWNYAAYGPNAQNNAYFMSNIEGIAEVSLGEDPDGDGPLEAPDPEATELSGLEKVDELTFNVTLINAFAKFPATIGYSGFFPVAEECLANFDDCNETPIGNGPYKIEGSWEHDSQITLVRNDEWPGEPGKADTLIYTIFTDVDAGYSAFQAGDIDVMYSIPPAEFRSAQSEYGDALYTRPSNSFTYVGLPLYNENFQDVRIRRALSMAINRQEVIDAVFNGRFFPAQGVVSPNFEGYRPGACEYCEFNPTAAADLLEEAGGWQGGPIELWANAGAGHDAWLEAVGHQLETNLGISFTLRVSLEFPEYLETAGNHGFTGPYRLGWGPDYPVLETYLGPLYSTGGSSNDTGFSNAEFDSLVAEGNAADSSADAIAAYQAAEDIIVDQLPVIPMWFGQVAALFNEETVENFVYNPISGVSYGEITLIDRG